jgi:hypothetical protein
MNDRLQQLALFVRMVESGSFSKTAREFGLSQPSGRATPSSGSTTQRTRRAAPIV